VRLVTFSVGRAPPRLGAVLGPPDAWEGIADLHRADRRIPEDMLSFIDACGGLAGATWRAAKHVVATASKTAGRKPPIYVVDPEKARLHAPLRPRLLRDFIAFRGHIARTRAARGSTVPQEWDRLPAYYNGNHLNILGPGEGVPVLRYVLHDRGKREIATAKQLDYEAELGYVLGTNGRDIAAADAFRCLFGVTIFNDFSARDLQAVAVKVGMGPPAGKDWANALGPCLVTRDELGSLADRRIAVRVNGQERLGGRYEDLVLRNPYLREGERALWSFEEMVDVLSHSQGIHAGELWGSGTIPGGCEFEKGDAAAYLVAGDDVEIEVEGIGILRNPVVGPV
jgi:2-keto-4-pentenoate hydratase/2-oxohepta-3-ene-1,7-dioic acid hydratase in catechol pathway